MHCIYICVCLTDRILVLKHNNIYWRYFSIYFVVFENHYKSQHFVVFTVRSQNFVVFTVRSPNIIVQIPYSPYCIIFVLLKTQNTCYNSLGIMLQYKTYQIIRSLARMEKLKQAFPVFFYNFNVIKCCRCISNFEVCPSYLLRTFKIWGEISCLSTHNTIVWENTII